MRLRGRVACQRSEGVRPAARTAAVTGMAMPRIQARDLAVMAIARCKQHRGEACEAKAPTLKAYDCNGEDCPVRAALQRLYRELST
jgi:hypothetical protein